MEPEKIIYFQINTQYENTGDALINKALITLLRKYGALIINDTSMPLHYIESLGLADKERISKLGVNFYKHLLKNALTPNKKVFLIAGPPGHLHGNSSQKSLRNIKSVPPFILLRLIGATIIKIGFSMGPLGSSLAKTESIKAKLIQFYLVRDSLSLQLAHKMGIKQARFFPDLAWMYKVDPFTPQPKNKINLSFRSSIVKNDTSDKYLQKLKDNILALVAMKPESYTVELIYQVAQDKEFCKKLYTELTNSGINVSFIEEQISLENAGKYYAGTHAIITNRLHGALLAYKYGALPIVLTDTNDHLKIKGIFTDAGISKLLLDVNDSVETNIERLSNLFADSKKIIEEINVKRIEYNKLASKILDEVFNV